MGYPDRHWQIISPEKHLSAVSEAEIMPSLGLEFSSADGTAQAGVSVVMATSTRTHRHLVRYWNTTTAPHAIITLLSNFTTEHGGNGGVGMG